MQYIIFRRRTQIVSLIMASLFIPYSADAGVLLQEKGKPSSAEPAGARPGVIVLDVPQKVSTTSEPVAHRAIKKPEQTKASTAESNTGATESLPFRVELGEGISKPETEVVLAVRAVTIFHCPEPPMQVLIGDTTGLGLVESIEGHDRADFYLRPTTPGIRTNMWIEMPSATVHVPIRTVAAKDGTRANGYNGEVFIRLPGFLVKSESLRARAAAIEKELGECMANREELTRQAEEEKRRIAVETEAMMADEMLAVLVGASFTSQLSTKPVPIGSALVRQVGSTVSLGTRRLWAVLEIENRDKQKTLWVQGLSAPEGYKSRTRGGRLPSVGPRKRVRVAVMVERVADSQEKELTLPKLMLTVEGNKGLVELRP